MATRHVLLGLLESGERHGYDLKHAYDRRFPTAKPIAFGQVYSTLDRLHHGGLIDVARTTRSGGPDRTTYRLTDAGRDELHDWLATVEMPSDYQSNPLSTKVTLALLTTDEATASDYLRRQRAAHVDRMRELTRRKTTAGLGLAQVMAADYALAHLDADLRWLETAIARVRELREELCP